MKKKWHDYLTEATLRGRMLHYLGCLTLVLGSGSLLTLVFHY